MTITASNHSLDNQGKDQRDKTNNRLLAIVAVVAMSMVGLAYASVPLYKLFCQVTGFGGTTQKGITSKNLQLLMSGRCPYFNMSGILEPVQTSPSVARKCNDL